METIDFNTVIAENISVVEGLLPAYLFYKVEGLLPAYLFYKGEDTSYSNPDDVTEDCQIYIGIASSWTNLPSGISNAGILETFCNNSKSREMQRYTDVSSASAAVYVRFKQATGWTSWGKV